MYLKIILKNNSYGKGELNMSETNNKPQVSQEQLDVLQQLLKPEVQESLNVLANNLPKLAELSTLLTKTYDFAQAIATDDV